jgi:hypothetical protein
MINGKQYGWEDITVNLPHGIAVDIDSIEYSDKKDSESVYGRGSNPRGYGEGNYSATAKVSIRREEYNKFLDYAKNVGRPLYKIPPFPVTVSYANDDQPIMTDKLPSCKLKSIGGGGGSQGDKSLKIELEFDVHSPIIWNGIEAN